jgi:hypothetical protein
MSEAATFIGLNEVRDKGLPDRSLNKPPRARLDAET